MVFVVDLPALPKLVHFHWSAKRVDFGENRRLWPDTVHKHCYFSVFGYMCVCVYANIIFGVFYDDWDLRTLSSMCLVCLVQNTIK